MKKSKVIIPAIALLAFSVAASITGTVAWFTANRVATIKASSFAVVNTTTDLSVVLGQGVGTQVSVDSGSNHEISVLDGYKLTDGSLDHAQTSHKIVSPDETGTLVGKEVALASADRAATTAAAANSLIRDAATHTYTAFTWDMTFSVKFGGSAGYNAGLFLDLSDPDSYMHEKVHLAKDFDVPASTYYTDAACTDANVIAAGPVTAEGGIDCYKKTPDDTGKAFRIAFVPKAIGGTGVNDSVAYAKVWAKNEVKGHCGFVDTSAANYALNAALDLTGVEASYGTATTKLTGHDGSAVAASATAGTDKVLMDSSSAAGIPTSLAKSSTSALSDCENFLGVFALDAGKTVSITYTCVAWFDGTDVDEDYGHIVSNATEFETIATSMKFGVANLSA